MAAAGASGLYVNPNTGAAQAGLMPFRNAIINGDMRINQRGTSTNLASMTAVPTNNSTGWVVDRWNVFRADVSAGAVMAQGTNLGVSDLPFLESGITTFARIGRTSGNALTSYIVSHYNMETQDSIKFKDKIVTYSFYYRASSTLSGPTFSQILTGTGTDQGLRAAVTGLSVINTIDIVNSSSWKKTTVTFKFPAVFNQIFIQFGLNPTGTAGAADYFDITGVQLELGSVATPFEVRPYPVELQLCQRYTYVISNLAYPSQTYTRFGMGSARIATVAEIRVQHPVTMRRITGVTTIGTLQVGDTTSGGIATGISIYTECTSVDATVLRVETAGGLTAFRPYYLESANTTATLILNAEL